MSYSWTFIRDFQLGTVANVWRVPPPKIPTLLRAFGPGRVAVRCGTSTRTPRQQGYSIFDGVSEREPSIYLNHVFDPRLHLPSPTVLGSRLALLDPIYTSPLESKTPLRAVSMPRSERDF